jgi:hypothetical protein
MSKTARYAGTAYGDALKSGRGVGVVHQTDEQFLAGVCEHLVPLLCGAISPKLVFDGARARGMTADELMRMCHASPLDVSDLQWDDDPASRPSITVQEGSSG